MISQNSLVRSTGILNELKFFLKYTTKNEKCNSLDLTKSALNLLKKLPACRSAVFELFSKIFNTTCLNYIEGIETEINTGKLPTLPETDELVVSEIHAFLVVLITENPDSWAPIISTWSLELLGEISSRYSGRAHISTNLNESLQLWMACRATRTLVDINTKCLSSLIHSDTEACISALLDTSVKHSPHFDWVVAHVGSCFPNTVITRVLSVGLKDFCQNKSYDQVRNSPKLKSVVGILGHLAGSHAQDIRAAILHMFTKSLRENFEDNDAYKLVKKATVPYILQLAYLSTMLLSSICSDLKSVLTTDIIGRLYFLSDDWVKYFGTPEDLEECIISLILKCTNGGIEIIKFLLSCSSITKLKGCNDSIKTNIKEKALEILQNILYDMEDSVKHGNPVDIVTSCAKDSKDLISQMLLDDNKIVSDVTANIIVYIGYLNSSVLIEAVSYLLQNAKTPDNLAVLIRILTHEMTRKEKEQFSTVLEQILSKNVQQFSSHNEETSDLTQMWNNLLLLLRWEISGSIPQLNAQPIRRAIESNLNHLTALFASEIHHMHIISDILDLIEIPILNTSYCSPIEVILNLTQSVVNYFFACCKDNGTSQKLKGFKKICRILRRLCTYSKVAKVLAIRELLERALFRSDSTLFGAKNNSHGDTRDKSLLKQNKKINKTIPLTKHSTVFNGGIIGRGKRKSVAYDHLPDDVIIARNTAELINVIKACCALPEENKYNDMSLDSMTLLSLLLVQFVSPDVMYNGLPWPEEDFSKVTIERDLFIRRMFTNNPLLWKLLSFVAVYRPALCYCSVLLRALTATLIHQWKSVGDQNSNETENLLDTTVKVIDVMSLGQLLPPPLCSIRDILPALKSYEILWILKDCIWWYMRDHIPSPALFTCDSNGTHWRDPIVNRASDMYTYALRVILQRNIKTLGHMYSQMFINIPKHDS